MLFVFQFKYRFLSAPAEQERAARLAEEAAAAKEAALAENRRRRLTLFQQRFVPKVAAAKFDASTFRKLYAMDGAAESAICLKASSESSQSAARARRPGDEADASALFGARRPCDAGRSIARTSWQQVGE